MRSRDHVVNLRRCERSNVYFLMTSWTIEKSSLNRNHRFKGFHKSNFSEPTHVKQDANHHHGYRHGLVQHFVEPGIEAKGEGNQLAYGSDTKYSYEIQKRASFR